MTGGPAPEELDGFGFTLKLMAGPLVKVPHLRLIHLCGWSWVLDRDEIGVDELAALAAAHECGRNG